MTRPQPPRRDSARLVSAAIGVVALVIALIVAGTADDTASPAATPNGAPVAGGQSVPGAGNGAAGDGGSGGRATTNAADCSGTYRQTSPAAGAVTDSEALRARFPLPSGAVKRVDRPGSSYGTRTIDYVVPGTIRSIADFYDKALPKLGVRCLVTGNSLGNPRFAAYLVGISALGSGRNLAAMTISANPSYYVRTVPAGHVVVELRLQEN